MRIVNFTNKEKNSLTNYINTLEKSRIKHFRNVFILFSLTGLTGLIIASYNNGFNLNNVIKIFIPTLLFFTLLCFFFFQITNGSVRKLKKDLKVGEKIKSTSVIKSINKFNHSVELENDKILKTRFYVNFYNEQEGLIMIKKGDNVSYIVSKSYEFIFSLKKLS